jgi:hypothetical protein
MSRVPLITMPKSSPPFSPAHDALQRCFAPSDGDQNFVAQLSVLQSHPLGFNNDLADTSDKADSLATANENGSDWRLVIGDW